MEAVTHLEKVITGEVSAVTHLEKVIAEETSAVTYTEKVIAGEAPPITHLEKVIAGIASPVTHLEQVWAGRTPEPTEHEYTGAVPVTIIANGQPLLDYLISGNMSQTGTPTPTTPIQPSECGDRTGNLAPPLLEWINGYVTSNGEIGPADKTYKEKSSDYISIGTGKAYTFSMENGFPGETNYSWRAIGWYEQDKTIISRASGNANVALSTNAPSNAAYCRLSYRTHGETTNPMLNTGSTPLPYEPYGYKIPILSGGTTTPIYLGEVQTTRKIGKIVLDGTIPLSDRGGEPTGIYFKSCANLGITPVAYEVVCSHFSKSNTNAVANMADNTILLSASNLYIRYTATNDINTWLASNPVTIWYVLATEETGIVNEPLRKIGDYADTVSYEQAGVQIPTNRGNTVIDVETELKPSEIYIKYKG